MPTLDLAVAVTGVRPKPRVRRAAGPSSARPVLQLVIALLAVLPCLAQAQDVDRGRELAQRWCANCHVVARSAQSGRADGLPTFPAIAAKPETTADSLRGMMTAAHGRMPDFSLGSTDQQDLIAYIFSLRQH